MAVERKWAVFGVLVLLTLISFIAVNKFWFYPYYAVQVQPPVPYTSPVDSINAVVIKPFAGTLRRIIQPDDSTGTGTAQKERNRNPFLWKGELDPNPVQTDKEIQPVEIPRLGMIIIGEDTKTAMLNDTLVHPGESYGGHVVEEIASEYVILSGEYGVLRISMLDKSFGSPKVDILEATNPNLLIQPVFSEKKKR